MTEQDKREKVVQGLKWCMNEEHDCYREKGCPYENEGEDVGCKYALHRDALELLKAQEPRVMSIGDLYGYDMGFYERRDEELVWPVLISRGGPDDDETVGFVRKDGYELRSDCGLMNITWRIWTAYPPHKLREATPWQ